jgi:predicted esterase
VKSIRVLFIHGLESSPQSSKAQLFAEHFTALTPAMDTSDFADCVAVQRDAIASFRPDIVVGSSFGGAVAVALLQQSIWTGSTLLLAQAAASYLDEPALPPGVRVWVVHGTRDELVDIAESRRLAETGSAELVKWIEVDDDHPLRELVGSGALADLVKGLHAAATTAEGGP